jgi:hypothetical protein
MLLVEDRTRCVSIVDRPLWLLSACLEIHLRDVKHDACISSLEQACS